MEVPRTKRPREYDMVYTSKRNLRRRVTSLPPGVTTRNRPYRARRGIFKDPRQRPLAPKYITRETSSASFLQNTLVTYDPTTDIAVGVDTGDRLTNRIFIHGIKVKLWFSSKNTDAGVNALMRMFCLDYADVNSSSGTGIFEDTGASNLPVDFGPGKILSPLAKSTVGCYHDTSRKIDVLDNESALIEVYIPIKQYVNYSGANPQRSIRLHWFFSYLTASANSGDYVASFTTYFKDVV